MQIETDYTLVVLARGTADACKIAMDAWKRRPRMWSMSMSMKVANATVGFPTESASGDDARLSVYECDHCGRQSIKEDWGVGRVVCPACGKVAPSASERVAIVASEEDHAKRLLDDLRAIGVVTDDACQGCGKIDCGGCPAGTYTTIVKSALAPETAAKLGVLWEKQRLARSAR